MPQMEFNKEFETHYDAFTEMEWNYNYFVIRSFCIYGKLWLFPSKLLVKEILGRTSFIYF